MKSIKILLNAKLRTLLFVIQDLSIVPLDYDSFV